MKKKEKDKYLIVIMKSEIPKIDVISDGTLIS